MQILKDARIIWRYLVKYKKQVYLVMAAALSSAVIAAFIPYLFGRLVDLATDKNTLFSEIIIGISFWFALTLISQFLSRYIEKRSAQIAMESSNDFVLSAASHLLELPIGFHKKEKIGKILNRIYRASGDMENITESIVFYLLPQFFSVIAGLAILTFVEWRLTLLLLVILIAYFVITIFKTNPIAKSQKKLMRGWDTCYGDMQDSVINVQVVKANANEDREKSKFKNRLEKIEKIYSSLMDLWVDLSFWQQIIFGLGIVSIFSLSILFLKQGLISAGQIIMFTGYINLVQGPFSRLANNYRMFKRGMITIKKSERIFEETPEKNLFSGSAELKDVKGHIEFKNVSFDYQEKEGVLKNIDFIANQGEVIALVGESGGGKTTIVDLISCYYHPKKGKVLLDGLDLQKINLESLRKNIAIVPQEITLFNDTIKNNIRYGNMNATSEEIKKAARIANAEEFILSFPKKYNQLVGERGIKLSTGQKQRVAIARAVLRNPKILILDEATSNLDSISEKLIHSALKKLIKGRTTFIIAHRLSTISHADKILVIDKGKIAEQGKHQDLLLQKGIYHQLFSLQSMVVE